MRRFEWRLQRVLDVTSQHEQARQAEPEGGAPGQQDAEGHQHVVHQADVVVEDELELSLSI